MATLIHGQGGRQLHVLPRLGVHIIELPPTRKEQALRYFSRNPKVEFAEPDTILSPSLEPNDPFFCYQWHLTNISCTAAWDVTRGSGVLVAVLDTGVDSSHPDLVNRLSAGWNTYDDNADTTDVHGHGTAVIGTVGATANNAQGGSSVAPECSLLPVRISDLEGYGYDSTVASGLIWAADHGARVANISYEFSGSATVTAAADYFRSKGGVVVVAAGNNGQILTNANNPSLITVSALRGDATLAAWSNRGNSIDLAAPGAGMYVPAKGGGYAVVNGTSFATPCVAGVAALVLSANPELTASQVEDILRKSADDLGTAGSDALYGWGRVNAQKAVLLAQQTAVLGDTNAPTSQAPIVHIVSPANGTVVSGNTTISVSATDDTGVSKVDWFLNGNLMGSSATAPASFTWRTRNYAAGEYQLQAVAYDAAGNRGASSTVTVFIGTSDKIAPTIRITSPTDGGTVAGTISVATSNTDNVGVSKVEWYLDGKLMGTSQQTSPVFSWDTLGIPDGPHTLQARAYDAAGNSAFSAQVSTTVNNAVVDTVAPLVTIESPTSGASFGSVTSVSVRAMDDTGITRVELYGNGRLIASAPTSSAVFKWLPKRTDRSCTLQAIAYDVAGNRGVSPAVFVNPETRAQVLTSD